MEDKDISSLLAERIAAGDFPSAVYLVAERGRVVLSDALGHAVREPEQRVATLDTVYDLASLTKPLVTGLLCARRDTRRQCGDRQHRRKSESRTHRFCPRAHVAPETHSVRMQIRH